MNRCKYIPFKVLNTNDIRDWVIYKITSPSGRVYIGKTTNFKKRKQSYENVREDKPLIYNSIKKYGIDHHNFEIIDEFKGDNLYSDGKEMFWIRSFMCNCWKWASSEYKYDRGMNSTDGGGGILGNHAPKYALRGRPLSESTKKKLSEACKEKYKNGYKHPNLGKKLSEERRKQIGLSKLGNKNNLGKNWSDERKEEFSIKRKSNKAVLQFDLNGNFIAEYRSIRVASRETGISRNVIKYSAKGLLKKEKDSRRLYIFKYKEEK